MPTRFHLLSDVLCVLLCFLIVYFITIYVSLGSAIDGVHSVFRDCVYLYLIIGNKFVFLSLWHTVFLD